jgi:hypothetical protein
MTRKQKVFYFLVSLAIAISLFCYVRCRADANKHSSFRHDTMNEKK